MQTPKFAAVPAVIFAIGVGMAMYSGYNWYYLPIYSADEIEQSARLNLALDLQRIGKTLPTDEVTTRALLAPVEAEIRAEIAKERHEIQLAFGVGLLAAVFALAQMLLLRRLRK